MATTSPQGFVQPFRLSPAEANRWAYLSARGRLSRAQAAGDAAGVREAQAAVALVHDRMVERNNRTAP